MSKIAFVFPGQGAQYTGMAKDFYEKYAVSRKVFENASKASGLDVEALCFEENDRLNITEYTQIAMLTAEIAILRAVEEAGIRSQVNAGLSLGEYGALVASGVMKEEDAFTVVRKRGIFMQEAYPTGGAMSAVLGTDAELIEKICNETQGIVSETGPPDLHERFPGHRQHWRLPSELEKRPDREARRPPVHRPFLQPPGLCRPPGTRIPKSLRPWSLGRPHVRL